MAEAVGSALERRQGATVSVAVRTLASLSEVSRVGPLDIDSGRVL